MPRAARVASILLLAYALALVAAQAVVRVLAWDMRGFDANLIDYTWQVELPWRATRGEWSGRDFHFPMGPLWQVFALTGTLAGQFSAPLVIAGMQVATQLGGIAVALWAGRQARGLARPLLIAVIVFSAYGAGISTLRPLLSVVHLVLYARGGEAPRWRDALAAAGSSSLLMLFSFDRLVFASLSVLVMAGFEWLARKRAGLPAGVAVQRFVRYALAQAGLLVLLSLGALLWGASPLAYLAGQRSLTASYAVNMAISGEGSPVAGATLFALAAAAIAAFPLLARQRALVGGMLVAGALPLLAFSAVQPNPGHVFMGALPVLVALALVAALDDLATPGVRVAAGLVATTFVFGWFGTFRGDVWMHPRTFFTLREVVAKRLRPQTDFVTDLGRAADFAKSLKAREPGLSCMGFSPALTAAHALADVPGPTSARIRWNAEQRHELARDIRDARCPYFVYQVGGFDRPDRPNWFIGEDLVAIAESYAFDQRLGPATHVLRRRETPLPARAVALPVAPSERALALGEELVVPLGQVVADADLLRVRYGVSVPRWAASLGAAPRLEYRFEREGAPETDYIDVFDLSVNRPTDTLIAVNPAIAEPRWIGQVGAREARSADAVRFRLTARGRFTPPRVRFEIRSVTLLQPGYAALEDAGAACQLERELMPEAQSGAALSRNVALRASTERVLLHPNPLNEQGAEVFFPIRPCADSCVFAQAGIELPPGSGDGAELSLNVIDGPLRPRIAAVDVLPGPDTRRIEVPLQRFANRSVLLRFGSLPRGDPSLDYLWVQRPRVGRCSARGDLPSAMVQGRASADGNVDVRGEDVVFGAGLSKLSYPFTVIADTCLELELAAEGTDAEFGYLLAVRADGLAHALSMGDVRTGAPQRVPQTSLHDWHKREVVLELHVGRKAGADAVLRLVRPRLARCRVP